MCQVKASGWPGCDCSRLMEKADCVHCCRRVNELAKRRGTLLSRINAHVVLERPCATTSLGWCVHVIDCRWPADGVNGMGHVCAWAVGDHKQLEAERRRALALPAFHTARSWAGYWSRHSGWG